VGIATGREVAWQRPADKEKADARAIAMDFKCDIFNLRNCMMYNILHNFGNRYG